MKRSQTLNHLLCGALLFSSQMAFGAQPKVSEELIITDTCILTDRYGDIIVAEDAEVLEQLAQQPKSQQIPPPVSGRAIHPKVQERLLQNNKSIHKGCPDWVFFPSAQPPMAPILGGIDTFGNTANQPGALVKNCPVSNANQAFKKWASLGGFDYSMHWAYVACVLDNNMAGTPSSQQYALSVFEVHWNILSSGCNTGTWINMELDSSYGLNRGSKRQMGTQTGLGSAMSPNYGVWAPNGSYVNELALMQSFDKGNGVVIFGVVDLTNYMDTNPYGNTEFGQFMNSSFTNSSVIPLTYANLGVLLQYQFNKEWYSMLSVATTNTVSAHNPFKNIESDNMACMAEIGWVSDNVCGMGAGGYRIQPFIATVGGETQPGIGFNFNQDLCKSPFALYGRAGVGGNKVTTLRGSQAQIAGGFVIKKPMNLLGICEENSNNFFGISAVWSKLPVKSEINDKKSEKGIEFNYTVQVTPTMIIQPNYQIIWDPAYNTQHKTASVFQIQVSHLW